MTDDLLHQPVLLEEAVAALLKLPDGNTEADDSRRSGVYVDATFGRGGHSALVLSHLGAAGRLIGIDQDPAAIAVGTALAADDVRFEIVRGNFGELAELVRRQVGGEPAVDGVLFDLGVSSPQLDDGARGFSFLRDGPLDMRMDPDAGVSLDERLASVDEAELTSVIREFGEEKHARRIARAILEARRSGPIGSTLRLADIVSSAGGRRERDKHPATRTFQALRIWVNGELDQLGRGLAAACEVLATGGRLVVISFHSLEDRIVKRFIRDEARGFRHGEIAVNPMPRLRRCGPARRPAGREADANPRARSAVLRVAERIA